MTDGITIDTSQLQKLAFDLASADEQVTVATDATLKRGAQNIKKAYRQQASSSRHFKGMAGSFTYEEYGDEDHLGYRIGPDKDRKGGALGNIFFFGTSRGGGSGDLLGPLEAEQEPIERAIGLAMGSIL